MAQDFVKYCVLLVKIETLRLLQWISQGYGEVDSQVWEGDLNTLGGQVGQLGWKDWGACNQQAKVIYKAYLLLEDLDLQISLLVL